MSVKTFRVTGRMKIRNRWERFSIDVRAVKVEDAIEKVYSNLGGRHKLKRFDVKIDEVKEMVEVGESS
ncbi:MAG: 50S ribosomal protein LX [Thermoprotei archaeon]|nr:MAG: 50S ribosomal protein LX [Thermoprotei archaeon]RLF22027.1 MAG: 50S ribosomal protein LX [Thermoprotei archaeon]